MELTPDQLLSTTRAVRKRLDLTRPVPRHLIEECVDLAVQAPTGRNRQRWHFVVVTDTQRRAALAAEFRLALARPAPPMSELDQRRAYVKPEAMERMWAGADHLYRIMDQVPAIVIPYVEGRTDNADVAQQASTWGSILPAVWSFMLAARARGLGTCWTTGHAGRERQIAEILGAPDDVMAAAFIPVAYTIGTSFQPAKRIPRGEVLHWDSW
ncbi:nitroreductase family protein [Kibdelosporangium philippinense]|uniref:Nitroreductase family protein n=1 Tax=Kibdelosporangium philippinense TaxID=211113 RepID=A0ABS8ZG33_9PSEU|nr:nitroreductase family protein [Kibdelosporangium philippinense]MCE7004797.1 nitroreductase family protein [Kibdelosporangium philippinense]